MKKKKKMEEKQKKFYNCFNTKQKLLFINDKRKINSPTVNNLCNRAIVIFLFKKNSRDTGAMLL